MACIANEWPCWRGTDRTGIATNEVCDPATLSNGPNIVWKNQIGVGFSSMVIAQGKLVTIGNQDDQDRVQCFETTDGKPCWEHSYPAPLDDRYFEGGPTSTPTIDGDRVYFLSRAGDVGCLRLQDGTVVWTKNLVEELSIDVPGWGFSSSPVVHEDRLLLNVGSSGMVLNKATGELLWHSEGEAGYMTPLVFGQGDKKIMIVASGKYYQAVRLSDGEVLWKQRWLTNFGCNAADPVVRDNQLFISSGYNRGSGLLDLADDSAELRWETKDFQNQWSSSILVDDHLYGIDGNDTGERFLKCLSWKSGDIAWSAEGFGSASILATKEYLLVLSDTGELIIAPISPKSFEPVARAKILDGKCWTVPILVDGQLYARNAIGDLIRVDLRTHAANK
jgi:outer membrane protein assembly factor BamB